MALESFDNYLAQYSAEKILNFEFSKEVVATSGTLFTSQPVVIQSMGTIAVLPSLPSGITSYRVLGGMARSSRDGVIKIMAEYVLGTIDISGTAGANYAAMPTITELGVSRIIPSPLYAEVTTALNATPGNLTVTYKDQDGNTAETNALSVITPSCVKGTAGIIALNSPDVGVTEVTVLTRSVGSTPTGVLKVFGLIPIMTMNIVTTNSFDVVNLMTSNPAPIDLPAGATIRAYHYGTNTAKAIYGNLIIAGNN